MRKVSGPRPWPIAAYAALSLTSSLIVFAQILSDLERGLLSYSKVMPFIEWNHDLVIVVISARLTIAAIPVALIWFRASQIARGLVSALTIVALPGIWSYSTGHIARGTLEAYWIVMQASYIAAATMLFTPPSMRFFKHRPADHGDCFD